MEVLLPPTIGARNLPRLYEICGLVRETTDREIVLNASEVEFIDPHGLTVLGALLSGLPDRRISMPWLPTTQAGYLDRMDFFRHCEIHDVEVPEWNRYPHPESLVELTSVSYPEEADAVARRLADAITGVLTDADPRAPIDPNTGKNEYERYRYPIWYSLSELLGNAVTHAKRHGHPRAKVWVAAQFYGKNNEVKLSVVDNGCGMLRTLAGHSALREHTHDAAIRAALLPRVSCNRDSAYEHGHGNQGVGLTTTMRIANAAKGRLLIASGNANLETERMRSYQLPNGGRWDGVAIAFSCRRHALPAVNVRNLFPVEKGQAAVPLNFVDD